MKAKDVVVGQTYATKIAGARVEVRVTQEVDLASSKIPRFRCVRVDNGRPLPKARAAAALHPVRR